MIDYKKKPKNFRIYNQKYDVGEFVKVIRLIHLVSDDYSFFKFNNKFGKWDDVFANYARGGIDRMELSFYMRDRFAGKLPQMMAYDIARYFWEHMLNDIILNKTKFKFPLRDFATLSVQGVPYNRIRNAKFNVRTMGKFYLPIIEYTRANFITTRGVKYTCKLSRPKRKLVEKLVESGNIYEYAKPGI